MEKKYIHILVICYLIMVATFSWAEQVSNQTEELNVSPEALKGLEARDALATANIWGTRAEGITSFIDSHNLFFRFDDGQEVIISLPEDEMMVATAPYISRTHPCEIHYISGCSQNLRTYQ